MSLKKGLLVVATLGGLLFAIGLGGPSNAAAQTIQCSQGQFKAGTIGVEYLASPDNTEPGISDVLLALAGSDRIDSFWNTDCLYAGAGPDVVFAGKGTDLVYGQEDGDYVYAGDGRDEIFGNEGNDRLYGGQDYDFIDGGPGYDICYLQGDQVDNYVNCEETPRYTFVNRNDAAPRTPPILPCQTSYLLYPYVTNESDMVFTDGGGATLTQDAVIGYEGNDTVYTYGYSDCLYGGPGADWMNGGEYRDLIIGDAGSDTLYGEGDDDQIYGEGGSTDAEEKDSVDLIDGGPGNDHLVGGRGTDEIYGGAGVDFCRGGPDGTSDNADKFHGCEYIKQG